MENLKELQLLLKNIKLIDNKYKILRDADAFNIFTVLRNAHDEVNLHSQFIGHLLNPDESHKKGNEFLAAFLKICGINDFSTEKVKVTKEEGKIDLTIKNKSHAIIIENKIYAIDQDKQLERYYDKTPNTIKVIYLTLNGREPSIESLGNKKEEIETILLCLSYKNDISDWMDKCIKIAALNPPLRETLLQYKKLIGELTGNTMNEMEKSDIFELFKQNNNILSAQKIVENWNYVKGRIELEFWCYLDKIITGDGFEIVKLNKYSLESINQRNNKSRRPPEIGLMIDIGKIEEIKFNLYIQNAGTDHGIIAGIRVYGYPTNGYIANDKRFSTLKSVVDKFGLIQNNNEWIGFKPLEPKINFESFSDETTLKLINKDSREDYIDERWAEIKPFIEACQKAIN